MFMTQPDTRQQLRQQVRQQRSALSHSQQQEASQAILDLLQHDPNIANMQHIALYLAFDGEVNLTGLIEWLWQQNKHVYVPLIDPHQDGQMCFHRYQATSPMQTNRFGISEPVFDKSQVTTSQQLDVVLAPLVAFDSQGNRLGMGGGYYDRLLATINGEQPLVIGMAHDCQQINQVPVQAWDQPLKQIITPSKHWRW
ncbi:5-formyltetrahydrofolate cyclo-ligase [Agarivorans sp. 1_MG-2023]|uniref:5-formyltetrahydrofolate cyclo-ligase n=1 Tax=Agarivorans sp. 1_MG-2023 TaxID=3062634 RepID=UPI0026E3D8B9|nr:5-formyltetrahydrofolate cyclo-ligase [Agarivorans sp. 1_MG-2023]MDO6764445.1 5-formyltetrahydrofolate cyclo-ligase [Agarivorans sp. 1_MG-2023]